MPSKRESSPHVDYVPALCTHRPSLLPIEWLSETSGRRRPHAATQVTRMKVGRTWSFRGSKSRNKVTVGEPAVGSLLTETSSARAGGGHTPPARGGLEEPACVEHVWTGGDIVGCARGCVVRVVDRWEGVGFGPCFRPRTRKPPPARTALRSEPA
jgi:hypothetical protein